MAVTRAAAAHDDSTRLQAVVLDAQNVGQRLRIMGQGSKAEYLAPLTNQAHLLSTTEHTGVIAYAPDELVVTVRGGTPLAELQRLLAAQDQMLACEPPQFRSAGTIGGAVAAGLAGPGGPWRGGVRDAVLGVCLLNGKGEILNFGGQVMKNVAGYDVSRLQVGACGSFGLLLSLSLRVAPLPPAETSCEFPLAKADAYTQLRELAISSLPVTALTYLPATEQAWVRLSGPPQVVADAAAKFGAPMRDPAWHWQSLRDHTHSFFATSPTAGHNFWRVSLPMGAEDLALPYPTLVEWGGALRWLQLPANATDAANLLLERVKGLGGHARQFGQGTGLSPQVPQAHQPLISRLQQAFDPHGVFNPQPVAHAN